MSPLDGFPPTREAAWSRIATVRPADYARTRNAIEGAVSRLSPYIAHGFVSLPEVLAGVADKHRLGVQHKFVFELGWREYFHHVWQHRGDGILRSLHAGLLPDLAYTAEVPADIREARTGIPVIDQSVQALYGTGYLHNHARMWLASYMVHLRKVHWRAGADWMVAHLLDGDLASNHLSWQWVAGTGSHKPYLFNAENVERYAPTTWHSSGTVIDTSYAALDAIARRAEPVPARASDHGIDEPPVFSQPLSEMAVDLPEVRGRDVWLVHPWGLGEAPGEMPTGYLAVGWYPAEHHMAWPWSAARWAFVGARMSALTRVQWYGSGEALARQLAGARSVHAEADDHIRHLLPPMVQPYEPHRLFPRVERLCGSFSTWWNRCTRGMRELSDLPGMAGRIARESAGSERTRDAG